MKLRGKIIGSLNELINKKISAADDIYIRERLIPAIEKLSGKTKKSIYEAAELLIKYLNAEPGLLSAPRNLVSLINNEIKACERHHTSYSNQASYYIYVRTCKKFIKSVNELEKFKEKLAPDVNNVELVEETPKGNLFGCMIS